MSLTTSTESMPRHGSLGVNVDYDAVSIPGSVVERYRKSGKLNQDLEEGNLPNLAATSNSDTIYLVHSESYTQSWRKWLVGPYCFLFMAAYITSYYTFTEYVYAKVQSDLFPDVSFSGSNGSCNVNKSSQEYKDQIVVQEHSSNWNTYISLSVGIPAVFSNMILGSSTDKFGRKFLFILPCIGTMIRLIVTVIGIYTRFNLAYFFSGYIIEGMTGQMFTMFLVSFTYVADITPENGKQRSFAITIVELTIAISLAVFSFTTGFFIQNYGFFYPMLSAGIMMAICFIIALFIPETFPPEKRDPDESSVFSKLSTAFSLFFGEANRGRRWMYNVLILAFTVTMFGIFGRTSVEPLYQLDEPFCWSSEKIGYYAALRAILQPVIGIGTVKFLQKYLSDVSIGILGSVSYICGNVVEGIARTDAVIYIGKAMLNLHI